MGPAVDASDDSFRFYSGGLYHNPDCQTAPADLDHAVIIRWEGGLRGGARCGTGLQGTAGGPAFRCFKRQLRLKRAYTHERAHPSLRAAATAPPRTGRTTGWSRTSGAATGRVPGTRCPTPGCCWRCSVGGAAAPDAAEPAACSQASAPSHASSLALSAGRGRVPARHAPGQRLRGVQRAGVRGAQVDGPPVRRGRCGRQAARPRCAARQAVAVQRHAAKPITF